MFDLFYIRFLFRYFIIISLHYTVSVFVANADYHYCLSILYYGIDVCPLTSTQINSLQFVVNSCYRKIFTINSNDDIRYCQDIFGCLPVADIVKRRTMSFSNKYRTVNDNNIVCQACARR